jgi:oligopeptide/dipeptide ABC transporter ATP-binding protein
VTHAADPLLAIRDLEVRFRTQRGSMIALDGVNLQIRHGEVLGLIGETGAGKSLTAWAALDLLPPGAWVERGDVIFRGEGLTRKSDRALREIRGKEITLIVQNPRGALNPMLTVGKQLGNVVRAHGAGPRDDWKARAVQVLRDVGIADPERRMSAFPHQLSGGMAQRVLIAMAIVNHPNLVIADEPTTGLDVTIQAEILDLIKDRVNHQGASMWVITHDLGIITNYADRAAVMFAGQVVEEAPTEQLFRDPRHPYTMGLVEAARQESQVRRAQSVDIRGGPPDLQHRPVGCQFAYRCPWVEPACRSTAPVLVQFDKDRSVRCIVAQRSLARDIA